MLKTLPVMLTAILLSGCVTLAQGTTQDILIVPVNSIASSPTQCTLTNEEGQWVILPKQKSLIHRDGHMLRVECNNASEIGIATVRPHFYANLLMADIFFDLCIISCWWDGANNAWFGYPDYISVEMLPLTSKK